MSPQLMAASQWVRSHKGAPLYGNEYPGIFLLALSGHLEGRKDRASMWLAACMHPHNAQLIAPILPLVEELKLVIDRG